MLDSRGRVPGGVPRCVERGRARATAADRPGRGPGHHVERRIGTSGPAAEGHREQGRCRTRPVDPCHAIRVAQRSRTCGQGRRTPTVVSIRGAPSARARLRLKRPEPERVAHRQHVGRRDTGRLVLASRFREDRGNGTRPRWPWGPGGHRGTTDRRARRVRVEDQRSRDGRYAQGASPAAFAPARRPVITASDALPPPLYIQPQPEPSSPAL